MKFLTLADWTGMVETELFAQTYRTYGLATVRYPCYPLLTCSEILMDTMLNGYTVWDEY
jgi:hypothetical protein